MEHKVLSQKYIFRLPHWLWSREILRTNRKQILFILTVVLGLSSISSQDVPNITPPSPTAYELGKYGQSPVGLFTGTPNVAIPLYEYQTNNLSIPISLTYNSNGIKVDQLSSNVGLGWSLNAGGVISRITRDKSDEYNNYFYPDEEIHKPLGKKSPRALEFFQMIADNPDVDSETDLFMYNFNGHTGQFIFNNNRSIVLVPHKDLQITYFDDQYEVSFKITTSDGVEYFFTKTETSVMRTSGGGHQPPEDTTTAWYLTQIRHPKGDIINLIYENNSYNYVTGKSQSFHVTPPNTTCGNFSGERNTISSILNHNLRISGKKLVRIESNNPNNGIIDIQSAVIHPKVSGYNLISKIEVKNKDAKVIEHFDFKYLMTPNKRSFLEEVIYKDPNKNYRFNYIEPSKFPARLSYSQDHWGYYNGRNNSYLFPNPKTLGPSINSIIAKHNIGANKNPDPQKAKIGLLQQIIYPTKGFERFEYEGNSYYGEKTIYPPAQRLYISANTGSDDFGSAYNKSKVLDIVVDQTVKVSGSVRFNSNECDRSWDVGKSRATVRILDNITNKYVNFFNSNASLNPDLGTSITIKDNTTLEGIKALLKEGHSYTITLSPKFECVQSNISIEYLNKKPDIITTNITSGGLRIKSIESYSSDTKKANQRFYHYGKKETLDQSSAEKGQTPYYISNNQTRISCGLPCDFGIVNSYELHSNSLRQLYNASVNNTYYKYVTISHGGSDFENGGEEHEFIIHNDYPGNPIFGEPIQSSPWVNAGWSNGLKKQVSIFKKGINDDFVTLQQTINTYKEDTRHFSKTYGYRVIKKHDGEPCPRDITYTCTQQDVTKKYDGGFKCQTNHRHEYFIGFKNTKCIAFGANNVKQVHYHHCYNKAVGTTLTYPYLLDHYDFMEYSTNSYWYYLSGTLQKQYDDKGLNPIETQTKYYYDNPEHLQPTRAEIVNSKEHTIKTKTLYPQDLTNPTIAEQKLIDQHQIAIPVQVETIENTTKISQQNTKFSDQNPNGYVLPLEVQQAKADNNPETRVVYHKYDQWGNPLEISIKGDIHTTYIWGYQGKYPVAKIENATFAQVALALAISQNQLENLNETQLSLLNSLRQKLPKAYVTTYTYSPLIGVTSITDPRGQVITYQYDNFNRLEEIKDHNGNILSKTKYNYKKLN